MSGGYDQEDPQGQYEDEPGVMWVRDRQGLAYLVTAEAHEAFVIDLKSEEGQALLEEQRQVMLARVRWLLAGGRHE